MSHQPSDTPDYEGSFYTVLDEALDGDALPRADDFIKITDGPQAVKMADGNVVVLLTFTPYGIELLNESCQHMHDHNCEAGYEFARYISYTMAGLVVDLD